MVLDDMNPKGMLAAFMQPDSSANEDEYALTFTMTNSQLTTTDFMSVIIMSSGLQRVLISIASFR